MACLQPFAILDIVNMKDLPPATLAALAEETAQVLQALILETAVEAERG